MKWIKRIQEANSRESKCFTEQDVRDVATWPTCAVGELKALTEKHGSNLDGHIIRLGVLFMGAVRDNDVFYAHDIYKDIEHHVKLTQRPCMI